MKIHPGESIESVEERVFLNINTLWQYSYAAGRSHGLREAAVNSLCSEELSNELLLRAEIISGVAQEDTETT